MNVFISWSGERSQKLAAALAKLLPDVLQDVRPWMSDQDIVAGSRWGQVLNQQLQEGNFGVLCLTPENLGAPWLLFEAGSLAKSLSEAKVVPYRLGLRSADVPFPLAQFQGVDADELGTRKLIASLNDALQNPIERERLDRIFQRFWPDLRSLIDAIPASEGGLPPRRPDRDLLEEILALLRTERTSLGDRVDDHLWERYRKLWRRAESLRNLVEGADKLNRDIPEDALHRIEKEQVMLADAMKRYEALIREIDELRRLLVSEP